MELESNKIELEYNKTYIERKINSIFDNYKNSGIKAMENIKYDLDEISSAVIERVNKDKVIGYRIDNEVWKAINKYHSRQAKKDRDESRKRDKMREKRILGKI